MMRLAEWQTTCGLPEALDWLWVDHSITDYPRFVIDHPPGSDGDRRASLICAYFDTVGALYKHGLVNEQLLFDWLAGRGAGPRSVYRHSDITRIRPYCMDAAAMSLQQHGWGSHALRAGSGHVTPVTIVGKELSTTRGEPRRAPPAPRST